MVCATPLSECRFKRRPLTSCLYDSRCESDAPRHTLGVCYLNDGGLSHLLGTSDFGCRTTARLLPASIITPGFYSWASVCQPCCLLKDEFFGYPRSGLLFLHVLKPVSQLAVFGGMVSPRIWSYQPGRMSSLTSLQSLMDCVFCRHS